MTRIWRWWMLYGQRDGQREKHHIPEPEPAQEFQSEGAQGAKDVNETNPEPAHHQSNSFSQSQQQCDSPSEPKQPQLSQSSQSCDSSPESEESSSTQTYCESSQNQPETSFEESETLENSESKGEFEEGKLEEGEGSEKDGDQEQAEGETEGETENEDENENKEQNFSGEYNTEQAFEPKFKQLVSQLRDRFYRFIEKIAEIDTKVEDPSGYDYYSMKKLLTRSFTKAPLKDCKVTKVKDSVLLILDNSGSMTWWADNISAIAAVAMRREDIEIYIAPNGYVEEKKTKSKRLGVSHSDFMRKTKGRVVIYVGDFDGADTPIELSWTNHVYWFCPETRYRRFKSHDWVHYDESKFRGMFFRVFDLSEFMNALRYAQINYKRFFYDPHEGDEFYDD